MNINKHLLKTSMTLMALTYGGNMMSVAAMESDVGNENLIKDEITTIDKYVFKGDTVYFKNPCYRAKKKIEKKLGSETAETVEITNGSALNFAAKDGAGNIIRVFSRLAEAPNPNGISHSGFVVNLDPREMYHTVLDIMPGGKEHTESSLSAKAGRAILRELEQSHKSVISAVKFPEVKASFAIESYGSAGEVLRGIAPHVHIRDLSNRISEYKGNVFVRPLYTSISPEVTMDFMTEYVGRPYENIKTLSELLGSVKHANTEERVENVFCSELVSLFYKKSGVFSNDITSSNVIPAFLSSGAGDDDLLLTEASDDVPLKLSFAMFDPMNKTKDGNPSCLTHCIYHTIMNTLLCCCKHDEGQ